MMIKISNTNQLKEDVEFGYILKNIPWMYEKQALNC